MQKRPNWNERSEKLTKLKENLPLRNRLKTGFFYPIKMTPKEKIECSFPCDGKDMYRSKKPFSFLLRYSFCLYNVCGEILLAVLGLIFFWKFLFSSFCRGTFQTRDVWNNSTVACFSWEFYFPTFTCSRFDFWVKLRDFLTLYRYMVGKNASCEHQYLLSAKRCVRFYFLVEWLLCSVGTEFVCSYNFQI